MERLNALGDHAVAIGANGKDLHFTSIELGHAALVAHSYVRPNAGQAESRSHGFFYKQASSEAGIVGLPIMQAGPGEDETGHRGSASVLYLENQALELSALGALHSHPVQQADDKCVASCMDWYGNARPLFLKDRVFALMGYELVEGAIRSGRIREVRRVSFAPKTAR